MQPIEPSQESRLKRFFMEITIISKEQYETNLKRLEIGHEKIIEAGGFMKAPKHWIDEYQRLAEECLLYETDNDMLPI